MIALDAFDVRPPTLADVPVIAETVYQGFESYRTFLPAGWDPPPEQFERSRIAERLQYADTWCRVAHTATEPAGHVAFMAARDQTEPRALIPGLAHLWMLFIREPWWGSGLARRLHALAVAEATARRYERMRLVTPGAHRRARAFYEREGWTTDGVTTYEPLLALELVEYRRRL